jgi:hypothetical protein
MIKHPNSPELGGSTKGGLMAKRRRRSRLQQLKADVLGMVTSARNLSKAALLQLRKEISATRSHLENLVGEERTFKLDLFGTGGPGRPRAVTGPRKAGRPVGKRATARKAQPRRKGPPKADKFFAKLPSKFTIDEVRKLAGKATPISVAQWVRAKRVKKTASGYEKVA